MDPMVGIRPIFKDIQLIPTAGSKFHCITRRMVS